MERKTQIYNDKFDDTVILDRLEDTKVLDKVDYSKKDTVSLDDDEILKELEQLHTQRRPIIENSNFDDDDFFNNGDFDYVGSSYNSDNFYSDYKDKSPKKKKSNKKSNKKKYIFIGCGIILMTILIATIFILHDNPVMAEDEVEADRVLLSDTSWASENDTIIEFGVPNEYQGYKEYYKGSKNYLLATYDLFYNDDARKILEYYNQDSKELYNNIAKEYNLQDNEKWFVMTLSVTTDISSMNRDTTDYFIVYKDNIMYLYDLNTFLYSKLYRDNNKYTESSDVSEVEEEVVIEEEDTTEPVDENALDELFKKAQEEKKQKEIEEQKKKEEEEKAKQEKEKQEAETPPEQSLEIVTNVDPEENN